MNIPPPVAAVSRRKKARALGVSRPSLVLASAVMIRPSF
jgi:hypothetical protein